MVDRAYQGQGAGRMLVKWGTAQADRLGVEVSTLIRCRVTSED
jgi:predicted N-acetyltransferase YhbS